METLLIVLVIALAFILIMSLLVMGQTARQLRKTILQLEKKIDGLQAKVSAQEQVLQEIGDLVNRRRQEPIQFIVDALTTARRSGWTAALSILAGRWLRGYLKSRGRPALPGTNERKEKR